MFSLLLVTAPPFSLGSQCPHPVCVGRDILPCLQDWLCVALCVTPSPQDTAPGPPAVGLASHFHVWGGQAWR